MILVETGADRSRCAGAEVSARIRADQQDPTRRSPYAKCSAIGPASSAKGRSATTSTTPSLAGRLPSRASTKPTLVSEPGSTTAYSNMALATVGYVIERTQKEPFAKLMQTQAARSRRHEKQQLSPDAGSSRSTLPKATDVDVPWPRFPGARVRVRHPAGRQPLFERQRSGQVPEVPVRRRQRAERAAS